MEETLLTEHPDIDSILGENILQLQVGNSLRVALFQIFHHIGEGDRRRGIGNEVEPYTRQVSFDGILVLAFYQQGAYSFLQHIRALDVQGSHIEDMHATSLHQSGWKAEATLTGGHDIDLMATIAELTHEVIINAPFPNIRDPG